MIEFGSGDGSFTLEDYAGFADLANAVRELRAEASLLVHQLAGRTLWMVNSTAQGGGVAEMLPKMIALLEELGLPTRWAVIGSDRSEFFAFTKRVHNLIHGQGDGEIGSAERQVYEAVNLENAAELKSHLKPDDLVVIHDPQPCAMAGILKRELPGLRTVWRCHIGLDERLPATRTVWRFLRPYADVYDQVVFSAPQYIPGYLVDRSTIIHPALDPQSHKNRQLSTHKLVGVLANSGLHNNGEPVLSPPFARKARRLQPGGGFRIASELGEIGLLHRPIVTQISRWDRLKGFAPLLHGFVQLKRGLDDPKRRLFPRHVRRIEIVRLVLAGPDPDFVKDDPEGQEVLDELCDAFQQLPADLQQDVALLTLPMDSRKENALMANALQRCSSLIVQNSLREGFGLTATEGMWKRIPVVGTHACGLRQQIRDGIDGLLVQDPEDADEIASVLDVLLDDAPRRDLIARTAQRRVHEEFLIFTQLRLWLRVLADCAAAPARTVDS